MRANLRNFFYKSFIVYQTLLYVLLIISCFLNWATYYGEIDFQNVGKIAREQAEERERQEKAEQAMFAESGQPVKLKKKVK